MIIEWEAYTSIICFRFIITFFQNDEKKLKGSKIATVISSRNPPFAQLFSLFQLLTIIKTTIKEKVHEGSIAKTVLNYT